MRILLLISSLSLTVLGANAQSSEHLPPATRTLAQEVSDVAGSVVQISTEFATGSGFYATPDGLVITARHVITSTDGSSNAQHITVNDPIAAVQFGTNTMTNAIVGQNAKVLAQDPEHDLALLSIVGGVYGRPISINGLSPLPAHHSAVLCKRTVTLQSGDHVFTVGYPLGELRQVTTTGIVASSQPTEVDSSGGLRGTYLVDMLINHGNSGGPVFSETGCVVGVADSVKLSAVEAVGPDQKSLGQMPPFLLTGPDGKPVLSKDGTALHVSLDYSAGLGNLIPQQYIMKLLDSAGFHSSDSQFSAPPTSNEEPH